MNVPKSIFRQYDVRGLVGRELTPDFARALGRAFGTVAYERLGRAPVVAVGQDNRPSGPAPLPSPSGITGWRRHRRRRRYLPTPALAASKPRFGHRWGILQVTGSHKGQPPGVQRDSAMVLADEAFMGDDILGLWEIIVAERWRTGKGKQTSDGSVPPLDPRG